MEVGPEVHRFWQVLTRPLLEAVEARHVIEIGVARGAHSMLLAAYCARAQGSLDLVDPKPAFDWGRLHGEYPGVVRCHRARSLEVLQGLGTPDVVLIDGDHNWATVHGELTCIHELLRRPGGEPLVLMHDIGWPYARRDLYHDPDGISPELRHPYARGGLLPGVVELVQAGLNPELLHAKQEGGARNGVLTAVEDFLAAHPGRYEMHRVPTLFGYGILASTDLIRRRPALARILRTEIARSSMMEGLLRLAQDEYVRRTLDWEAARIRRA